MAEWEDKVTAAMVAKASMQQRHRHSKIIHGVRELTAAMAATVEAMVVTAGWAERPGKAAQQAGQQQQAGQSRQAGQRQLGKQRQQQQQER